MSQGMKKIIKFIGGITSRGLFITCYFMINYFSIFQSKSSQFDFIYLLAGQLNVIMKHNIYSYWQQM